MTYLILIIYNTGFSVGIFQLTRKLEVPLNLYNFAVIV